MVTMSTKVFQNETQRQEENTAKLVMSTFYKLTQNSHTKATTAEHIARYLREKFGDVFRTSALVTKAEETLSRSAALGFLNKCGKRGYAVKLARGACVFGRRRRRRRGRCRCRRRQRRRRSSRRRSSRRRRRKRCSCS